MSVIDYNKVKMRRNRFQKLNSIGTFALEAVPERFRSKPGSKEDRGLSPFSYPKLAEM
jgi:hypothetical protein